MEAEYQRRVVVTGLGVIAANGRELEAFWESLCRGESGACEVTRFPVVNLPTRIAAEIQCFERDCPDGRKAKRHELAIRYALWAARAAMKDSGLGPGAMDPERAGLVEATSVGGMESTLKAHRAFLDKGYKSMSPFTFVNAYCGSGSGELALDLGIRGHVITYCSGSASGNDAVGYAWRMIRDDEADVMVAGGAEAPLLEGLWSGFCRTKVMTRQNERPQQSMKPFDRRRDGFLLGEGGAFLVLEELAHALQRRARIYAEVAGQGRSCEAYHSILPHPEGVGIVKAAERALRHARLAAEEVDYVNAHGTATESHDLVETLAIKKLMGKAARRVAVSGTKPVTGHMLGAAGAIETLICAMAIDRQRIPPTINFEDPAEGCDLDYVPGHARSYPVRVAMNLNSGFGGKNSCLLLKRFEGA